VKRTARRREREQEKKKRGECLFCTNAVYKKHTRCHKCLEKQCEQRKKREQRRIEAGECVTCGAKSETHKCSVCYLKNTSRFHFGSVKRYQELFELWESQSGICPYTGNELKLGVNTTLDHILPKSRDGTDDIENLQWVFCSEFVNVNTLKWDMTDKEFKGLIKTVYEHTAGANGS
jgi:CRISPR/Cas system Type II protein with McrA/HNH and RuvC-like nuclease domain